MLFVPHHKDYIKKTHQRDYGKVVEVGWRNGEETKSYWRQCLPGVDPMSDDTDSGEEKIADNRLPGTNTLVHRRTYDPDGDESASMIVVEALAEAKGVCPADMDQPLYDVVDPDALDRLFRGSADNGPDGRVVFTINGYEVTVTSDGEIYVRASE